MARSAEASVTITDVRDGVAFKEVELYKIDSPSTPPTGLGFNVNTGAAADAATGWTAVAPTVTVNQLLYRAVRGVQLDAGATLWTANPSEDWVISLASGIRGQIGSAGAAIAFDVDANLDSDADKYELIQSYRGDNAVNNADIYWQVTTGQVFQWQNPSTTSPTIPAGQSFTDLTTLQGGFLDINGITEIAFSPGGDGNIGIGENALANIPPANTAAINNISIGYNANQGGLLNGGNNLSLGYYSLLALRNGSDNIALGTNAGWRLYDASENIAIGRNTLGAFHNISNCHQSTAIGINSLSYLQEGKKNIGLGTSTLSTLSEGSKNSALGDNSGGPTIGSNNVFINNGDAANAVGLRRSNTAIISDPDTHSLEISDFFKTDNLANNLMIGQGSGSTIPRWIDRSTDGTELVSNGELTSGTSGWGAGNNAALTVETILTPYYAGYLSNNYLKVARGTVSGNYAYQAITTVIGATYVFTAECQGSPGANETGKSLSIAVGTQSTGTQQGIVTASDLYKRSDVSLTFVATSTTHYVRLLGGGDSSGEGGLFGRITVKRVPGRNTIIGQNAATSITTGSDNITIGTEAGKNITSGVDNICIGNYAIGPSSGSNNITIGKSVFIPFTSSISNTTNIGNSDADRLILNGRDALTIQYASNATPTSITQYGDQVIITAPGFVGNSRKYLISFSVKSTSNIPLNCKLRRKIGTAAVEEMAQIETVIAGTNNVYSYEIEDVVSDNTNQVVYSVTARADSPGITDSLSIFQLTIKKVG